MVTQISLWSPDLQFQPFAHLQTATTDCSSPANFRDAYSAEVFGGSHCSSSLEPSEHPTAWCVMPSNIITFLSCLPPLHVLSPPCCVMPLTVCSVLFLLSSPSSATSQSAQLLLLFLGSLETSTLPSSTYPALKNTGCFLLCAATCQRCACA